MFLPFIAEGGNVSTERWRRMREDEIRETAQLCGVSSVSSGSSNS